MSDLSLTVVLRRIKAVPEGKPVPSVDGSTGEPITLHGFRSTLRVWAGEETACPRKVMEAALAHAMEGEVEADHARTDLQERRRALMEGWERVVGRSSPITLS